VLGEKWIEDNYRNYGWYIITIDGNDMKQIMRAIDEAKEVRGKPTLIIARTVPGKGVKFMENDYHWHGKPPVGKEVTEALDDLGKEVN